MVAKVIENIKEKVFTLEEYYELEEKTLQKHEFHNGKIIPMPNASINHNVISGNIFGHLFIQSYQRDTFKVFNADQKVYIQDTNSMVYPDVFAVKEKVESLDDFSIVNPIVIIEVASDSTSKYDRNGKFKKYQTIQTFKEYILVDQNTPSVEVFFKTEAGWIFEFYLGLDETVKLQSIDCEIKMSDIYKNVQNLQSPQGKIDLETNQQ